MLTHYDVRRLPDGRLWIAEEHVTTEQDLAALLSAGAGQRQGGLRWLSTTATEGDQTPGG